MFELCITKVTLNASEINKFTQLTQTEGAGHETPHVAEAGRSSGRKDTSCSSWNHLLSNLSLSPHHTPEFHRSDTGSSSTLAPTNKHITAELRIITFEQSNIKIIIKKYILYVHVA